MNETTKILRRPDVAKQLNSLAMEIVAGTPEQYRAFIKAQTDQWAPVIKSAGMRAD